MQLEITPALVTTIADLAGIEVPVEDVTAVIAVMTNQVAMATRLRPLDFSDVPPITSLDPRWV
jgi:hypothetical protein